MQLLNGFKTEVSVLLIQTVLCSLAVFSSSSLVRHVALKTVKLL